MSKINKAFENGKAFISFITVGDPSIEKTVEFIERLAEGGCDLIELGVPFSDPIAEGEVIERANLRALKSGATTDSVFEAVACARKKTSIPIVLLTYMNPVFVYGTEKFFKKCAECGVDGVIIPDLPYEEITDISDITKKYSIDVIRLIAPTSKDRIQMLAKDAEGFIYVVSSMGVTGVRKGIETDLKTNIECIRQVTSVKTAVGFGISTEKQAADIAALSDGVIIGSAIVKIIEEYGCEAGNHLYEYARKIKNAITL